MDWLRSVLAAFLIALPAVVQAQAPLAAPWQVATSLSDVDLAGLTPAQKTNALKLLREIDCSCGCSMKVAQCRVEDPACAYSKGIAALTVKGIREGKSADEVKKLVADSAIGRPRQPQKILEDPVNLQTAGAPSTGPASAKIVLVEFSDFECPYCSQAAAEIRNILAAYPKDIRLVYKQFPLSMHPHANMAASASLAALEQGKFWELHDKMFANFRQLSREHLLGWAQELGLDLEKFKAGLDSPKNQATVLKDLQEGETAGVSGTPSIFINGKHFNGPINLAALKPYLDEELKKAFPASRP
jgi:protein-disulfide isomerase